MLVSAHEDPEGLVSEGPRLRVSVVAASRPWWRRFWWVGLLMAGFIAVAIGLAVSYSLIEPPVAAGIKITKLHPEIYASPRLSSRVLPATAGGALAIGRTRN